MKNKTLCVFLLMIFLCCGCASLQVHEGHYVDSNDPAKGVIYIAREKSWVGAGGSIYLKVNGEKIGAVNSGTYFVYVANPGRIKFTATGNGCKENLAIVDVKPGKKYYLKVWYRYMENCIELIPNPEGEYIVENLMFATLKTSKNKTIKDNSDEK